MSIPNPAAGTYTIAVNANHLGSGARQTYALVITGNVADALAPRRRAAAH
ncbi:MAG TPA: hypothetical protein VIV88_00800 [Gemmatimonadales bacterium]